MWFERLTGFKELSPENVRANFDMKGDTLISKANGKKLIFGELQIATLLQLRELSTPIEFFHEKIKVNEVIADVQELHCQDLNANSLFQVASQFNLLEMADPSYTPESGIDGYERDYTQGPACAIACGAGTIYRNYFIPLENQIGQTSDNQFDCLDLIGKELKNDELNLWTMRNGYALMNRDGLLYLNKTLSSYTSTEIESLKNKLKLGIQWNTAVTIRESNHLVSQIYCSALPVSYSNIEAHYWEKMARLILEAAYEATFYATLINLKRTGVNRLFLTLVGGGAFGNESYWIIESIEKTIQKFRNCPLDVRIVSYGRSNPNLEKILNY